MHARHSSVTIYYCRFPNQYLSEIQQYGKTFINKRTFTDKIKLLRTNKYSLRNIPERVELFCLLAKLLWYLVSSESKVSHLSNFLDNPLHCLVNPPLPLVFQPAIPDLLFREKSFLIPLQSKTTQLLNSSLL